MTTVPKKQITTYSAGAARESRRSRQLKFLEHYAAWPETLKVPAAVTDALATLNAVLERPAPAAPLLPAPSEYLSDAGDAALDRVVLDGLIAPKRVQARKEIAAHAAAELDVAIDERVRRVVGVHRRVFQQRVQPVAGDRLGPTRPDQRQRRREADPEGRVPRSAKRCRRPRSATRPCNCRQPLWPDSSAYK